MDQSKTVEGMIEIPEQVQDNSAQADRLAKFYDVHGLKEADYEAFVDMASPFVNGEGNPAIILDGMGGYGEVTAHILSKALVAFTKQYMASVPEEVKKSMEYVETADNVIFEPKTHAV